VFAGDEEVTGEANLLRGDMVILPCWRSEVSVASLRRNGGERSRESALGDGFFEADSLAWLSRELQRRPDECCTVAGLCTAAEEPDGAEDDADAVCADGSEDAADALFAEGGAA
jgi:hypothetical protein